MELKEFLIDWTLKFVKNKDIMFKKIVSVEKLQEDFDFKVVYKDKVQYFVAREDLNEIMKALEKKSKEEFVWCTIINSKENFDLLLNNWERLIQYTNLTICFINPFSSLENKWMVKPAVHNMVSESATLAGGLKSMAENVEGISEEDFKKQT